MWEVKQPNTRRNTRNMEIEANTQTTTRETEYAKGVQGINSSEHFFGVML